MVIQAQDIGPYVIVRNSTNNDLWLYGDLGQNPVVSVGDVIPQGAQIGVEGNPASTSSTVTMSS